MMQLPAALLHNSDMASLAVAAGIPTTYQGCASHSSRSSSSESGAAVLSHFSSKEQLGLGVELGCSSSCSSSSSSSSMQVELEECASNACQCSSHVSTSIKAPLERFSWIRLYASLLGSLAVVQVLAGIVHAGEQALRPRSVACARAPAPSTCITASMHAPLASARGASAPCVLRGFSCFSWLLPDPCTYNRAHHSECVPGKGLLMLGNLAPQLPRLCPA